MRLRVIAATMRYGTLVGLVVACGSEPRNAQPDLYVGTWSLAVEAASGCWPAFPLRFTIDQVDADRAGDELLNVVAEWWTDAAPATRAVLTGNINWHRDDFTLVFAPALDGPNGAEFTGVGASPDQLTGTFTDTSGAVAGHLGCAAGATATHVSTAVE